MATSFAYAGSDNQYGYGGVRDDNTISDTTPSTRDDAQEKISSIFSNIETIGNTYNAAGGDAAALALVDASCRAALERAMQTRLFDDIERTITPDILNENAIGVYVGGKFGNLGQTTLNQLCAALQGNDLSSPDIDALLGKGLRKDAENAIIRFGKNLANSSGLPFLSRLEIEAGTSQRSTVGSITSVQPLWQDDNDLHHVFAQISWHKAPDSLNEQGAKDKLDTYNGGLAYRYLTTDKKYLYGANVFFDYAPKGDHTRMSLGVDARTSQLAFAANRYMPLSSWRKVDSFYEERASSGWDVELRGQTPELPSWTGILKGYQWDAYSEGNKLYGVQAAVEYSPVPALAVRMGVRDESEGSASLEAALRFNYRFDQPQDLQFRQRTELAAVSDYVYDKVSRDNIIRIKQRRTASSKLTVIETNGSNNASEVSGLSSLFVNQTLLMPVTVTTQNAVGAYARLRLSDGSTLTLGQNTQVLIEPTLITLINGAIQYISNGSIQNLVVPGGTIVLQGTDIDVVSTAANTSSVRVRDGGVTFTGSTSGSIVLGPEELAQSLNGVIGSSLPVNDPLYISHTDRISSEIDRIANQINGAKVAPYPYEEPRILSATMTIGQQIVIGLLFNDSVIVSAGTPQMNFTINGNARIANYAAGSGTNDLLFVYTVQAADIGATTLTVNGLNKNGASIMGNGKDAVFTIADSVLSLTVGGGDVTPPSGYTLAFTTDPVNATNQTAGAFQFAGAEIGATYAYSITSSGGGAPVTGTGVILSATQTVTGIDLSSLGDGTLTVSATLTDAALNVGTSTTDTVVKDAGAPSGYATLFTTAPITVGNQAAAAIRITSAEVGATYSYSITSSGGGAPVTGTGTVSAATQNITGLNLTGLNDGTLTVSVTLTDTSGNAGAAVTNTTTKDAGPPTGYATLFTTAPINAGNVAAAAFQITGAEVGATYNYSITSSGGGAPVTGTGTIATATQNFTGLNLTGLGDGTLTVSMTLTDTGGNAGAAVTNTTTKDVTAPTGYATLFTTAPITVANQAAAAIRITAAEVGATYNYSITSSGGGAPVTGTGTVSAATENITGLNVTGLNDGTLTVSVTLTDTSGNAGAAVTNTTTKDATAPTGYAVAFTTNPINSGNKSAAAFQITGAEVGATYAYSITSTGGGAPVTGTGTIATATQNFTGIDLTSQGDGTFTVSMTLTDTAGNAGTAATGSTGSDTTPPSGYATLFTTTPITSANQAAAAIRITSAEVGATYNYSITSSGGGAPVTGTGTISAATENITGLNVSGLGDGTLTVSVTLTDTASNVGAAVTNTTTKDATAPSGYATLFTTAPITAGNQAAAAIRITSAEVGATYNYSITSSGGGAPVTGTGTVSAATENITGLNVSGLGDGTLTVSVTLTDTSSNVGAAVTNTTTKDANAPTGYSVLFTTDPVNLANFTAGAFQFAAAEVGATYNYSITSSGGGTPVTGSGTIATATDIISGINLTPLGDGTLTVSVTLTDTGSNVGGAVTDTVIKDIIAPTITSIGVTNGTYEP